VRDGRVIAVIDVRERSGRRAHSGCSRNHIKQPVMHAVWIHAGMHHFTEDAHILSNGRDHKNRRLRMLEHPALHELHLNNMGRLRLVQAKHRDVPNQGQAHCAAAVTRTVEWNSGVWNSLTSSKSPGRLSWDRPDQIRFG